MADAKALGKVELRGHVSRESIDVIDAVVAANPGMNRMDLVDDILKSWAKQKVHEAILIQRVTRDKGFATE